MITLTKLLGCTRAAPYAVVVDMDQYLAASFIRLDRYMSRWQQLVAVAQLEQMFAAGVVRNASFWGEHGYVVMAFDEAGWPYFRVGEEEAIGSGVQLKDFQNKSALLLALQLVAQASAVDMFNVCVEWGVQLAPGTRLYSNGEMWSGLQPYKLPASGPYHEDETLNLPPMVEATAMWRDPDGQTVAAERSYRAVVFEAMLMLATDRADGVIVRLGHAAAGEDDTMTLDYQHEGETLTPCGRPDKRFPAEDFLWWCRDDIQSGNFATIGYRLKGSGKLVLYSLAPQRGGEEVESGK